jgi:hypothetical protein
MQSHLSTADIVKAIAVSLALSILLVHLSHSLTFGHIEENVFNTRALIRGQPELFDGQQAVIHPFYNRILFSAAFEGIAYVLRGWTGVQVLVIARFASFAICLSCIFLAMCARQDFSNSLLALAILTMAYISTLSPGWIHGDDIFDLTFCFFVFLFLAEQRYWPALAVALLTSFNRETGAFSGVAYLAFSAGKERMNILISRAGALLVLPYIGAIAVRKIVLGSALDSTSTGQWITGITFNLNQIAEALRHPSPISWLALLMPMMLFPWLFFLENVRDAHLRARGVAAFAGIFAITSFVGIVAEIRIYIPCIALLIAGAVAWRTMYSAPAGSSVPSYPESRRATYHTTLTNLD